ncbi:hydrolase or acyltransferase, alpha/beta fold family [Syntrophotalea carbinolica DSM 2380]|uniref:Hydrolase or acyltransferase, alpha/beta fold family n=1 Tax=Syntrophotalea carbinolica (strain DSM 2380 / NBRC 103641 / GraBd1) TaxID=338963 RepID=Q3A2C2_SYNC1|nr:alpha/beta hydrolase [Syntrophotalea carbinolica]ABA89485.2 hydrolase or acyltransferase, alpha/beta fold family [Syntrophotalea carbinolica DSM 2380]
MSGPFILDHDAISARLFYPWPDPFLDPFYVKGAAGRLGCWYGNFFPEGMTMFRFHGNGETVREYRDDFSGQVADLKINLLLAEYRGYGMAEGRPLLADMLKDFPAIVEATGVSADRVIFFGRALGSLYAVHAAALYPRAAGLVVESGIADPLELIMERVRPKQMNISPEALRNAVERVFDQRGNLAGFSGRTVIMHTRNDELISVSHGESLYALAGGAKRLVVFERGYHNNIREVNENAYWGHLREVVRECSG